jgi:hypothetical protein
MKKKSNLEIRVGYVGGLKRFWFLFLFVLLFGVFYYYFFIIIKLMCGRSEQSD